MNATKLITLSNGKQITVRALSPLLMQHINSSMPPRPQVPTYTADTAGGGKEVIAHDETTLQTDEEKAAWKEYLDLTALWKAEQSRRFLRVFFARGVVLDMGEDDFTRWAKEMAFLGVQVPQGDPEDPEFYLARQVMYVETELIGGGADMVTVMQSIMRLTGVDEGEVAAATNLFQSAVEGAGNNAGDAG